MVRGYPPAMLLLRQLDGLATLVGLLKQQEPRLQRCVWVWENVCWMLMVVVGSCRQCRWGCWSSKSHSCGGAQGCRGLLLRCAAAALVGLLDQQEPRLQRCGSAC